VAYISYVLLVCAHSPRWPTLTRCSSALILHAGVLLLHVSCLTSFLMTYIQTCGRNAMLGIGGLHLVRVARLSTFAALAYSYTLVVCPHSPCWPTSRTGCSSALILHAGLLFLRVARLTLFLLTYIRTCGSNAVFGIGGLHLVHVARLSSFATLAHSYALLVFPPSPCWATSPTCSVSALILPYLLLVSVARLLSFCPYSPRWPTSCMHFSSALMRRRMCPVRRD